MPNDEGVTLLCLCVFENRTGSILGLCWVREFAGNIATGDASFAQRVDCVL